uniref:Uncharacterized protein n=1 Tax=Anguilla anguilla TaxID=7936 RepID=A0A0E9R3A2_ANGAN
MLMYSRFKFNQIKLILLLLELHCQLLHLIC